MKTNKNENKMLKRILIAVLAIIVLGSSSIAFAWWDKLTVNNLEQTITLGEGLELVVLPVVVDPVTAGNLIPASAVEKDGDTYQVVLTYTVRFEATLVETLDLAVEVANIEVNAVANPFGLISVAVTNPGTIFNDDVVVTLTVTIDDSTLLPADYDAAYLALANNSITFNVSFAASRQA